MSDKEKAIKAIELLIRTADKQFNKAKEHDNYVRMAVLQSYQDGLEEALAIVKLMK